MKVEPNPVPTLYVGQTQTLKATVSPNEADQRVTWDITSTSSSGVVTITTSGLFCEVAAKKVGSATITVTSVADPSMSSSCTVTVQQAPQQPNPTKIEVKTVPGGRPLHDKSPLHVFHDGYHDVVVSVTGPSGSVNTHHWLNAPNNSTVKLNTSNDRFAGGNEGVSSASVIL